MKCEKINFKKSWGVNFNIRKSKIVHEFKSRLEFFKPFTSYRTHRQYLLLSTDIFLLQQTVDGNTSDL